MLKTTGGDESSETKFNIPLDTRTHNIPSIKVRVVKRIPGSVMEKPVQGFNEASLQNKINKASDKISQEPGKVKCKACEPSFQREKECMTNPH